MLSFQGFSIDLALGITAGCIRCANSITHTSLAGLKVTRCIANTYCWLQLAFLTPPSISYFSKLLEILINSFWLLLYILKL